MNSILKILLKKQFLSTINGFGKNKRNRNRSVSSYVVLIAFVSVFMGLGFYYYFNQLGGILFKKDMGWLVFAIAGVMAVGLSVLGSVFMAVSQLYDAKDNDFLLSLPIPPRFILFVRMVPLYVQNLIFSSVILVPAFISKCVSGGVGVLQVAFYFLLMLLIPLFALFITCLLGFVISLITSRMRDKTFATVLFSFLFSFGFFFLYFYTNNNLTSIIQNGETIGEGIKTYFYPLYSLGRALDGDAVNFAVCTAVIIALFVGLYAVLSKTYIKFITSKRGGKKTKSKNQNIKSNSAFSALFVKEIKRFFGSAMYFLNCGFGCLILVIILIVFSVKKEFFISQISQILPINYLPAILLLFIVMISSLNCVSAPSISLEGKNLWILQSLPIDLFGVLKAKLLLHYFVTAPIATITSVVFAILLRPSPIMIAVMVCMPSVAILLFGAIGLVFNLKKPNLDWENETILLKQSASVLFSIITAYLILGVLIGFTFVLVKVMSIDVVMLVYLFLLALSCTLTVLWLKKKGAIILGNL